MRGRWQARRRARDERGAIAVVAAISTTMVLVVAGLAVEIGHLWAIRGQLQVQVDQAALYAASSLPVRKGNQTDERRVAKQVAYYIACHPVTGQRNLPDCPSSTTSASLDPLTQALLTGGLVAYPTSGSIRVRSPESTLPFSFGRLAGQDSGHAQMSATARIGSPGEIEPMALSLNCLLSAAGNLPLGLGNLLTDVLPLNYIAPGPISIDKVLTDWPSVTTDNGIELNAPLPASAYQGIATSITVTGSGWGDILDLLPSVKVGFAIGKGSDRTYYEAPGTGLNLLSLVGTATVAVPPEVMNRAGVWEMRVAVRAFGSSTWKWSKTIREFTVNLPPVTQDILGCGRLVKSPRDLQDGTKDNLLLNLQDGLDHPISTHPDIASLTLPSPLNVANLLGTLNGPSGLFQCTNSADIKDVGGSLRNEQVPNCMVMQQGSSTYSEFTDGMLGPLHTIPANAYTGEPEHTSAGRLVCTTAKPCRADRTWNMTVGTRTVPVNDDRLEDFIVPERKSLLTSAAFFNLSTYLLPGLPIVTPDSALKPSLYSSHRFMWVPVISSPYAPNDAGVYPVLTFRPVFVTQDVPSGLGFESVDMVLDLVDLWVKTALNIRAGDDHGIVMNNEKTVLRALRFMTIEPSALPAVPADYSGPMSDYVGVGPKIVRLVR